jgi:hypothetical protein
MASNISYIIPFYLLKDRHRSCTYIYKFCGSTLWYLIKDRWIWQLWSLISWFKGIRTHAHNQILMICKTHLFSKRNSCVPTFDSLLKIQPDRIGSRGFFFYLLFQCFINGVPIFLLLCYLSYHTTVEVDGLDDHVGKHFFKSLIIGGPGSYVPFPSHSFLVYMGPQTSMLLLDCR